MPVVLGDICRLLGVTLLVIGLAALVGLRLVKRWKRNMDVSDDAEYAAVLKTLSEASVRRHFNPYTDIDWEAQEFVVTKHDSRWVLSTTDPLGSHHWYRGQPLEEQIAIGMWRQANLAKVCSHFETILIRGLMQYALWAPNGSPEYRYCMHEAIEECNHTLMFQEMVNRTGQDVPGMPRWLHWLSCVAPLAAGPLPNMFFFGVLAGEMPFDYVQTNVLREDGAVHPIVRKVAAIHVAEEARHISFAHLYLRKRVPQLLWVSRLWLSLYVPIIMRVMGQAVVAPPRGFFITFGIPRSVRRQTNFTAADSRQAMRDMFADVRMLCHELGLMNPLALLVWRLCKIDGRPSRHRSEPQRTHQPTSV